MIRLHNVDCREVEAAGQLFSCKRQLQERIAAWVDDLMNGTNAEPAEQVVQLNIQLFPHRQN